MWQILTYSRNILQASLKKTMANHCQVMGVRHALRFSMEKLDLVERSVKSWSVYTSLSYSVSCSGTNAIRLVCCRAAHAALAVLRMVP